jgi:NADH:ubiquinone oxidoreductase subunit 2 (subunit N)
MSVALSEGLMLAGIAWPLVVAGLLILPGLRSVGLVLTPWAALPALVLSIFPDSTLKLPDVMLGGILALDATGRVFLLLTSILWLASGVLARARLRTAGSNVLAVMLLLAMTGSFGLVLAGDALLFFAAATVAGYSLYGALAYEADTQTRKAGRVLVVLLVFSDLLVFEVLLMLAQAAGALDFESLRDAFVYIDSKNMILGLLIAGFGTKIGVLGVHFWTPTVFARASAELRPAMVAFMFSAGLLGSLRLIPLGQIDAKEAATILQWLAWVTLAYAGFAGLSQTCRRAILGYAAIALSSVWLVVLSACLQQPELWQILTDPSAAALIQSGAGLAAILLIDNINEASSSRTFSCLFSALAWLVVVLLAIAPLGLVWVMDGQIPALAILSAMAIIALLAGNSLFHGDQDSSAEPVDRYAPSAAVSASRSVKAPYIALWVIAVLIVVATLAAGYQLFHVTIGEAATGLLIVVVAITAAVLNARWRVLRLRAFPPGDVLVPITQSLVLARVWAGRLFARCVERWTDITQALDRRIRLPMTRSDISGMLESLFLRWRPALSILLLLGLLIAWLAAS